MSSDLPDIKPVTPVTRFDRSRLTRVDGRFKISEVGPVVGMSKTFIRKVAGKSDNLTAPDILELLDQDSFSETFIPRSKVIDFLMDSRSPREAPTPLLLPTVAEGWKTAHGNALQLLRSLPSDSVQCVVTSTPYWALRIYKDSTPVQWADGSMAVYGHEQTPEEFIRHTAEILHELGRVLTPNGSIWWNVMDSFNTRTQIRGNAAEALRAMQGRDSRSWGQHDCRRYSAGHSYLKDGEQCLIPSRIAERASRMGFFVKTMITWAKRSTLPEPQSSRVSKNLEYVIHLTKGRTPQFFKESYRSLPAELGGRNNGWETDKLSDVWTLPTSSGRDGHGAQFPLALPARCIALSTGEGEVVLDPFVGSGNAGVAALALNRRFLGIDISEQYLTLAQKRLSSQDKLKPDENSASRKPGNTRTRKAG